ncbi:MAG: SRPBCC family protein [Sphingomonadales bacterium]
MAKVTVNRKIKAPLKEVWASWDDFGNIYKFNPALKHSKLLEAGTANTGLGTQRHCDLVDGKNWVQEEIIEYQPEEKIKLVIFNSTMPLKTAVATIEFRKNGAKETEINFTMEFSPKFGLLGQMMVPLMKPQFKKMISGMIDGNDRFVTQGILANPEIAQAA